MPFKVIFYSKRATLKGKNRLPVGSIFFPLTVAPFQNGILNVETDSTVQKLVYQCISLLRMCAQLEPY